MGIVSDYSGGAVPLASTQQDIVALSPQRSQSLWLYTGCGLFNCAFHYNAIFRRCQLRNKKPDASCSTELFNRLFVMFG
jgi:hypothetical protein